MPTDDVTVRSEEPVISWFPGEPTFQVPKVLFFSVWMRRPVPGLVWEQELARSPGVVKALYVGSEVT